MALNKMKKLIEDLEQNSTLVMANPVAKATSAGYGGTAYLSSTATLASSAAQAGTSYKATSAAYAGTARIAQWGSAGTGALA